MAIGAEEISQPSSSEIENPLSLREFGEIPKGFASVYIVVLKERLNQTTERGICVEDNKMDERNPEVEKIFKEEGKKCGSKIDRTKCVFAYPRPLDQIRLHLTFNPETQVILEAKINPKTAIVANGEYYTEAASRLTFGEEAAREWASTYWKTTKSLTQYLSERHNGSKYDFDDFLFPEVLTPSDIPPNHLKLSHF